MTRMIDGIEEMKSLVGQHLGNSPYTETTPVFEVEGPTKPSCVAEVIDRYYV